MVSNPAGKTTSLWYNAEGTLSGITDPLLHSWSYFRDILGRLVKVTTPLGYYWLYEYDAAGRLASYALPHRWLFLPMGQNPLFPRTFQIHPGSHHPILSYHKDFPGAPGCCPG